MPNVYIEPRPKGRPEGDPIDDYVVEDHAATSSRPSRRSVGNRVGEEKRHTAHVARVRHLNDKKTADHGGRGGCFQ